MHYEKTLLNIGIELDEDPFDGEREAYEQRIAALERRNATQADTIRRLGGELAKCERERDELLGCTKEMVRSVDGIGQQRDAATEKERARAHDRAVCASRGIPDRFLTGQRYRIDVSVDNGDPVECVAGALWSSMDLAKTLGLGPEDIKRPLLQALAIFGHNVEITTKAGPRWDGNADPAK